MPLRPHAVALMMLTLPLLAAAPATRPAPTATAAGGYLFATFRGEKTPLTEQIYFALSQDGKTFQALNAGNPSLVSELGEKGVRDPFLLRSHDGSKVFLIATDLSINRNGNWKRAQEAGSRSIVVWESTDLVKWSEPRLVKVAPDDAGCTWAPEAVYDDETGDYLVFWASKTKSDNYAKQRIWAARTRDFVSFSKPFIYIEKPSHIIDTTIVKEGNTWFRFSKDESVKAILMETAPHLTGEWKTVETFSLATLRGVEGPAIYPLTPGTWCLILDRYARGQGYKPYLTTNLASGQFTPADDITFPFLTRHGTVLPLTQAEYARLQATIKPTTQPSSPPQPAP